MIVSTVAMVPAVSRPSAWPGNMASASRQDDVLGQVVVHGQLLEDDPALVVDVPVTQGRRGQHVAEQLEGQRQLVRRARQ